MFFTSIAKSEIPTGWMDKWSVGISGGYHNNIMRFSELNKDSYDDRGFLHSGLFAVFAEYDINGVVSVRPEVAFLKRGGEQSISRVSQIKSGLYSLKSGYFDFRIPVLYNFTLNSSLLKPYAYATPVLGFSTGGNLHMSAQKYCGEEIEYDMELSNGNIASAYLAFALGGGVKYPISFMGHTCYVGVEAGYELGLTDTYSKVEKSGEATNKNAASGTPVGTRKYSGMEVKVSVQVPLNIFKKKKSPERPVQYRIIEQPIVVEEPEVEPEKPCYTLEEIILMVSEGKNVKGKIICAINEINFDTNKSIIKEDAKEYLNKLAHVLTEIDVDVEVKGHTDNTGTEEFNQRLSKDRAVAVVNYLVANGVSKDRISYSYYGEKVPLATNDTPEGRQMNRRVEFEIMK